MATSTVVESTPSSEVKRGFLLGSREKSSVVHANEVLLAVEPVALDGGTYPTHLELCYELGAENLRP